MWGGCGCCSPPCLPAQGWGCPAVVGVPAQSRGPARGARPAAVSRERKQPGAGAAPAGRRGGAGSWNKSQEGLLGSSWSGLQRMELGTGREKAGGERSGAFSGLSPAPAVPAAPAHICHPAQHHPAGSWGWRLRTAPGQGVCIPVRVCVHLQWEERTWMEPAQEQPLSGGPIHWEAPILNHGVSMCWGAVPPALGCRLSPVPITTAAHSSPAAPLRPGVAVPCVVPAGRGAAGGL